MCHKKVRQAEDSKLYALLGASMLKHLHFQCSPTASWNVTGAGFLENQFIIVNVEIQQPKILTRLGKVGVGKLLSLQAHLT